MDAGLAGGIELGEVSVGALIGVRASVDGLAKEMERLRRAQDEYQWGAVEVALRGASNSDAAGDSLVIDVGGPAYGRLWQIRRLAIGGALWTSVVAGTALVVISPNRSASPPLSDVADQANSLPLPAFYSTGQLIVRHPNRLSVVILTPTASTTYAVGGAATDLPDRRHAITVPD